MKRDTLPIAPLVALLLLAVAPASRAGDEEYRERRTRIEEEYAPRYMAVAERAKRIRAADLVGEAYGRAEALDPGLDSVIAFDPEVEGSPRSSDRRQCGKLAAELAAIEVEEARARLDLAVWCDDEARIEDAVAEAATALALAPGPVAFDERGVLREKTLGELPLALSLAILEEHEVFKGRLVPLSEVPETIRWDDAFALATAHYDLRTNASGRICRTVARALEAAREIYEEMTGFEVEKRITVWIVATRKQYEGLWRKIEREPPAPENVGKCVRDFCGVDGSRSEREVVSVAIHEVAHGYLNLGIEALTGKKGATMPAWFHEGLATYCAGYGPGSLSYDRGVVLPRKARAKPLARFREIVAEGGRIPMADFLLFEEASSAFYYQAYAFAWFWYEVEDDALRARYARAVAAMEKAELGEDRAARGREIFLRETGMTAEEIEARFLAWLGTTELDG